jgi:hypothetical protein
VYRYQPTELEMPRSCHQILGVSRGASAEDLALAFVRTGMACHPSNAANESDRAVARRRLREAADAWAVLSGRPIIGGDAADVQAMQAFESALAAHALGMARYGHDADGILQALVAEGCPPVVAWPVAELEPLANPQLGVDPRGRGEGWPAFARAFEGRWGYGPGLAEAAGYDAGQLVSLAATRFQGQPGWDLQWFLGHGRPLPLCAAIAARRLGGALRPQGAASHLDGAAGRAPSAALRLSQLPARP